MSPKVSVIVPIYNVENYLSLCLESIVNQTLKDIEIICVNDGSTDSSYSILQNYAKKDSRIMVINKKNGGLSSARNAGLKKVNTEYVTFIDSDDFINPETLEKCYNELQTTNADAAVYSINVICPNDKKKENILNNVFKIKQNEISDKIQDFIHIIPCSSCNKLFRVSLIKKYAISYPDGYFYEDLFFHFAYFSHCSKILFMTDAFYNYNIRNNSIMGQTYQGKDLMALDHVIILQKIIDELKKFNLIEKFKIPLLCTIAEKYSFCIRSLNEKNHRKCIDEFSSLLIRNNFEIKNTKKDLPTSYYKRLLKIKNRQYFKLLKSFTIPFIYSYKKNDNCKTIKVLFFQLSKNSTEKSFSVFSFPLLSFCKKNNKIQLNLFNKIKIKYKSHLSFKQKTKLQIASLKKTFEIEKEQLFYQIADAIVNKEIFVPKIVNMEQTLNKIIEEKASLARFGDGEFLMMMSKDMIFQKFNPKLAVRLMDILAKPNLPAFLVGIPKVFGRLDIYVSNSRQWWNEFIQQHRQNIYNLLNHNTCYYDAFLSRPYMIYQNKDYIFLHNYFSKFKQIWDKRNILIVEGLNTRLGVGNDLFNNALSVRRILCPDENAFEYYDEILKQITTDSKDTLIILSLGATATVLAYDLYQEGYQALDLGHIDIEYEWFLKEAKKKIPIKGKNVAEIFYKSDIPVLSETYNQQIIKNIGSNKKKRLFISTGLISLINCLYIIKNSSDDNHYDDTLEIFSYNTDNEFFQFQQELALKNHNFSQINFSTDLNACYNHYSETSFNDIYMTGQPHIINKFALRRFCSKHIIEEGIGSYHNFHNVDYNSISSIFLLNYFDKFHFIDLPSHIESINIEKQNYLNFLKKINITQDIRLKNNSVLILGCGFLNDIISEKEIVNLYAKHINKLEKAGYNVVFKPHPREKNTITPILKKKFKNLQIILSRLPIELIPLKVQAIMSPGSGSLITYAYLYDIPAYDFFPEKLTSKFSSGNIFSFYTYVIKQYSLSFDDFFKDKNHQKNFEQRIKQQPEIQNLPQIELFKNKFSIKKHQ